MQHAKYTIGIDGRPIQRLIGWDGQVVTRTPSSHPYAYDAYFIWKSDAFRETDHAVYSDRMYSWNSKAFNAAVAATWPKTPMSQMFGGKMPTDINRFLNLFYGKEVELTGVLQGCNVSNGYPYWIFAYRNKEDA